MPQIIRPLKEYFADGVKHFSWWKAHIWIVLAVPSVLWWRDSIIFVILLSLFANYESSMAEYKGDKAREENGQKDTGSDS